MCLLKWMKKGIILDDKITENRAKEGERSLLSSFSSQRKTQMRNQERDEDRCF